ncbi:MAG TPA: thioredoxin domain-containing protein [Candidatus Limnocylindria bacterium]|nr:thioredoxin domain-containing protein [Candidatus Limnocylindria bacterium]
MKKTASIIIIVLVCLGFAYFLFKISPDTPAPSTTNYNSALNTSQPQAISQPPAFDPATDHYLGSPKAKNVFIEYGDMQCPACAAYSDILNQVPATFTDTVFVFRYFPLIQIHKNSVESALAVEAAGAQGKFWEMHDLLFAKQPDWEGMDEPMDTFVAYAQQVGVTNIDQFKNDITSKKYLASIQKGFTEAAGLNLPGTPSLFFNGHVLKNQDLNGLKTQAQPFLVK